MTSSEGGVMKALAVTLGLLLLLALNWAALHDIVKGEPSLALEYGTVVLSAVAVIAWLVLRRRPTKTT
jgi:hypothetical protein